MAEKTNFPDSDKSARPNRPEQEDEMGMSAEEADNVAIDELQVSGKSGKHSAAMKLAASRPDFDSGRRAEHVDGAFGKSDAEAVEDSDMGLTEEHRSPNEHKKAFPGA